MSSSLLSRINSVRKNKNFLGTADRSFSQSTPSFLPDEDLPVEKAKAVPRQLGSRAGSQADVIGGRIDSRRDSEASEPVDDAAAMRMAMRFIQRSGSDAAPAPAAAARSQTARPKLGRAISTRTGSSVKAAAQNTTAYSSLGALADAIRDSERQHPADPASVTSAATAADEDAAGEAAKLSVQSSESTLSNAPSVVEEPHATRRFKHRLRNVNDTENANNHLNNTKVMLEGMYKNRNAVQSIFGGTVDTGGTVAAATIMPNDWLSIFTPLDEDASAKSKGGAGESEKRLSMVVRDTEKAGVELSQVQRFLQNEAEYLNTLEALTQVYLKRISDERVLTMTEIKIVFSNAEQLFQLHREILSDLRKDLGLSRLDFSQSNVRTDFSATRLISVFSKWVPFFKMYTHFSGSIPISEAYLFALLYLVNGQCQNGDPSSLENLTSATSQREDDGKNDAEQGYEITLEALCYGKEINGAKSRGKNLSRLLYNMMEGDEDENFTLHQALIAPTGRLQYYLEFFESLESESVDSQVSKKLVDGLRSLTEQCRQRQSEVDVLIRLMEWDWVLDFGPLEGNWSESLLKSCQLETEIQALVHTVKAKDSMESKEANFSLLKQPIDSRRKYLYHGFVDMAIVGHSGFHPVLAILFSDMLLMAQPIDLMTAHGRQRGGSHRRNWIVHSMAFRSALQPRNGLAVIQSSNNDVTSHIQINMTACPPSLVYGANNMGTRTPLPQASWQINLYPPEDTFDEWSKQIQFWGQLATASPSDILQSQLKMDSMIPKLYSMPSDVSMSIPSEVRSRSIHSWIPSVTSKRASCINPLDPQYPFAKLSQILNEPRMSQNRDSQATFVAPAHAPESGLEKLSGLMGLKQRSAHFSVASVDSAAAGPEDDSQSIKKRFTVAAQKLINANGRLTLVMSKSDN